MPKGKDCQWASIKAGKNNKDLPLRFLKKQAEFLQKMIQWERLWTEEYVRSASLEHLAKEQEDLYAEEEGEYHQATYYLGVLFCAGKRERYPPVWN